MRMMRVVVAMVALAGSEGRAGEHHQEQGGDKKLLHSRNRSMFRVAPGRDRRLRIKNGTGRVPDREKRRKLENTMTHPAPLPRPSHKRFFFEKFGITEHLLERCLGEAL